MAPVQTAALPGRRCAVVDSRQQWMRETDAVVLGLDDPCGDGSVEVLLDELRAFGGGGHNGNRGLGQGGNRQ